MSKVILKIGMTGLILAQMVVVLTGCENKVSNTVSNTNNQGANSAQTVNTQNIVEDKSKENSVNTTSKQEVENNNTQNVIENKTKENSVNTDLKQETKTSKTEKEIVEELYENKLKNSNPKLKEYKIVNVSVLTGEDRKEVENIYSQDISAEGIKIKDKDIIAEVKYSVKPEDIDNSPWVAGNGELEGEWIVNKVTCLVITYNNGTYEIASEGTGW